MKKIVRKYALTTALAVVVIISMTLSIVLWSNPSYKQTQNSNPSRSDLTEKTLASLYMPNQAIYTGKNGKQWLALNSTVNVIGEVHKRLSKYHYDHIRRISYGSNSKYFKYLHRQRSIALNYQNNITFNLLKRIVNDHVKTSSDRRINRIIVPTNHHRFIYLLCDSNRAVYKVNVKHRSLTGLRSIVKRSLRKIPVRVISMNRTPIVEFKRSVSMPRYEYLINRQTKNYDIMHLLNNAQKIGSVKHRHYTAYNNGSDRQLRFDHYQDVTYINDHQVNLHHHFDRTLMTSYHNLLGLNLPLTGIHYFESNPRNQTVVYRDFVENFPVFNPTQLGLLSVKYLKHSVHYNYSLESLQIPLPDGRKDVRLPSTRQILTKLKKHGFNLRKIQAIELGYRWQNARPSKDLANLTPSWFIEYHHRWISYRQLLKNLSVNS